MRMSNHFGTDALDCWTRALHAGAGAHGVDTGHVSRGGATEVEVLLVLHGHGEAAHYARLDRLRLLGRKRYLAAGQRSQGSRRTEADAAAGRALVEALSPPAGAC